MHEHGVNNEKTDDMNVRFATLLCLVSVLALFSSCKTRQSDLTYFENADSIGTSIKNDDYVLRIAPADELLITVNSLIPEATTAYNLPLTNPARSNSLQQSEQPRNQTYIVDKEGNIQFPVFGKLHVEGMTTEGLASMLTSRIAKEVTDPTVRVQLLNFRVNVLGEVTKPGAVTVNRERYSVFDALADAEDLTEYGRRDNVLLIRDENGKRTFHRLNLGDANIVNSPYFYLRQNDVIYVEPNKIRASNAKYDQNNAFRIQVVSAVISVVSVVSSLVIALVINNK